MVFVSFRINRRLAQAIHTGVVSVFVGLIASPVEAQSLQYKIQADQKIPYSVTVTAETPSSIETMKGMFVITGKGKDGDTLMLGYQGGLNKSTKSKSSGRSGFGPRFGPPPIPGSPFDRPTFGGLSQTTSSFVVSNNGEVESMRGASQLPYLLGNLALFPFEILPKNGEQSWEVNEGLTITEKSSSNSRFGPSFGPFANNKPDKVKTGGHEITKYRIKGTSDGMVTISKTYSLSSPAATKSDSAIEIQGTGSGCSTASKVSRNR